MISQIEIMGAVVLLGRIELPTSPDPPSVNWPARTEGVRWSKISHTTYQTTSSVQYNRKLAKR